MNLVTQTPHTHTQIHTYTNIRQIEINNKLYMYVC